MFLKAALFTLSCVIAWFVLLPILVIGGGIALFAYATFAEFGVLLTNSSATTLDTAVAREIARQMCGGGYGAKASGTLRHYT